ncbi:hypothetical protein PIB30_082080 [Stylosanthes scabra]|uniref:Uncharacterized protein n=1 Tax=Stylosanthes scabra TaxID=79078 RepID=A0ABU6XQI7_9FABA|nr:hypothetical protein [Stylosanthes scabra]
MESTRLPRPIQHRQQDDEDEDHPIPQAEEGNEEGNEKGQGYEHDYHHQLEVEWKNEERKLAEQETKFGSNSRKSSTHMRGSVRICVQGLSHPRRGIPDQA